METHVEDENGKLHAVIVNYMKGRKEHSLRPLGLSDYELDIFNKIRSINEKYGYKDNDYIFCDKKGRMSPSKIDKKIRDFCENCKIIPPKSAHDIRRTVATELYYNGVDLELIRKFLGHEDIASTEGYIYDFEKKKKDNKVLIKGRVGLIGLTLD